MPVVPVDYEDLVGLIGRRIPREELVERVPMMGGAYDGEKEGKLLFEFFPNRPDLLSVEGLARACRAFFDVAPGLHTVPVQPTGDEVRVDASVRRVRPHIGFARVDGLTLNDALLDDLIQLQERLTTGPGRKRKKVAVGIHDSDRVRAPFTYKTVGRDEHAFVPLQMTQALTPAEIFERHDKGRLYGPLLEGKRKVPLIVDADDEVLSLPPVINGQRTALTTSTRNLLVDVTGTDARATQGVLGIVVASLAERGGRVGSYQLTDAASGKPLRVTPDLSTQSMKLPLARVRELLGLDLPMEEVAACLRRMGHDFAPASARTGLVTSPAWRLDLLHPDDLVEDVGIGYGFDRFTPRLPQAQHFGSVHALTRTRQRARTLLLGLGFAEVVTLTITSRRDALDAVGAGDVPVVEVENPVTLEHSILRPHLYTSLLGLLRANRHRELPQNVFEVGFVVSPVDDGSGGGNQLRAAAVRVAPRATFAECKGLVEAALRDLGRSAALEPGPVPGMIPGRSVRLTHDGTEVGFFGEVHPDTVTAFELAGPAFAFELRL